MKLRAVLKTIALCATMALAGTSRAQELVVWHDLGDNGIKWFQSLSAEFAKSRPGVTVRSINYPTDQWFGRSISAITLALSEYGGSEHAESPEWIPASSMCSMMPAM